MDAMDSNLMKTDIKEMEDGYELEMDLPGFKKEEISDFPGRMVI